MICNIGINYPCFNFDFYGVAGYIFDMPTENNTDDASRVAQALNAYISKSIVIEAFYDILEEIGKKVNGR
jgi:hypothetical protein